ncbi:TatD family hydrolase, partial [Candidatus Woesearchaeota archaeon]|nr:TatD family hydrolase [Candidatus Woesearchaeota archaeon]
LHCFTGNLKLVKRIENNGWFLSIPTNIVFSSHFQAIANQTSISNILTETDSPYLSPIKGERNEPSLIKHTIKKISEIKSLDYKEVENIIFMNFQRLFLEKN